MLADMQSYLPGDILAKTDRAAMAVSLEGRVPFLDPEVVALAARIPIEAKIGGGEGKRILRTLLYRYVPRALVDRPKAGFAVPVAAWLKGPLRPWADDLFAGIPADGLLDRAVIAEPLAGAPGRARGRQPGAVECADVPRLAARARARLIVRVLSITRTPRFWSQTGVA